MSENEQELQETPRAAAAFLEYCALGPARSLRKLAALREQSEDKATTRLATFSEWSTRYKWQERVKQYDAERTSERIAKKQADREKMEDRHAEEAKEEQEWARKILKEGKDKGRISLAAVQLLKNSREDERKALVEEEMPATLPQGSTLVGIAIYLPQKHTLKGGDADVSSES